MKSVLLISIVLFSAYADAAECQNDWVPYKDEICIKAFPNILPYAEAKDFCSSQGNSVSKASLVMIKGPELQDFLGNYTHDMYNTLWLGGRYDEVFSQFRWNDGELLTYTNWQEGYPRNSSDTPCIELRPINTKSGIHAEGLWADVNCQKQNQVMCQRALSWTLEDAINEIIRIRKELETTREDLNAVNSRVVPVGSIYIQYFNQPSPTTLWPTLTWQDVSSTYAGLFFRASGGASGNWGETQDECAPRLSQVELKWANFPPEYPMLGNISSSGWSEWSIAGAYYPGPGDDIYREAQRFNTQGCEVRPKNQAVRVWKRTV